MEQVAYLMRDSAILHPIVDLPQRVQISYPCIIKTPKKKNIIKKNYKKKKKKNKKKL